MSKNSAELIYERWKASLRSKDRSKNSVPHNFDELFEELKRDGTDFETAHEILPKAIKAHQPSAALGRQIYKQLRKAPNLSKSEQEFIDDWNQSIADAGTESFYAFFDIKRQKDDDDGEPKVFGNMSAREYATQRRYAESFPILDTAKLEEQLKSIGQYNPVEDILNVFGDNDGKTNR